MNESRWSNIERARQAYDSASEAVNAGPLEAFFEVAARCNLHCQMCAINYDSRYQPRSGRPPLFSPDLFQRLEPIFPTLVRAYLFGLGEPLLNPHLVDYVRKLSEADVEVWFNTNATLIDEAKAERLASAGAARITVSIDGASAQTYERIRVGATFNAVMRGIRSLLAAQKKYGRPIVNLSFVAMASNIAELPQLVDLCAELGAEGIHVEPLFAQHQTDLEQHYQRENLGVLDERNVKGFFQEAMRRAEAGGVKIASRFLEPGTESDYLRESKKLLIDWKCSEPWSSIWVTSAGEIRTCCINETSFGNLFEKSIEEIWNSEDFRVFRRQHASRQVARGCANCVRNGRVRHSPFFAPIQAVTYRPIERRPADGPSLVNIESPTLGATVTDPIVVVGQIYALGAGTEWEIMLDYETLGVIRRNGALRPNGGFVFQGSIPFVSEGAHLLWIRRRNDSLGFGYCYREVHLWRPEASDAAMRVTSACALRHFSLRPITTILVEIDALPWEEAAILRPDEYSESSREIVLDLKRLPPGSHQVSLLVNGERTKPTKIHRLACG